MAELAVVGIGVATADPELKYVGQNNSAVCTVQLAFNRSYKEKNATEWKQETTFMRAQVWGARAEKMNELVKKGQPIYVKGYLKQDNWEKDGEKRVGFSISIQDFQLCVKNGKKKNSEATETASSNKADASPPDSNDEIPF